MSVLYLMTSFLPYDGQMDKVIQEKLADQESKWTVKLNALQKEQERRIDEVQGGLAVR